MALRLGYGSLGLSVEGAHRSDVEIKSTSASVYTMQYKPHEPGVYLLNVKFADDHVAGRDVRSNRTTRLVRTLKRARALLLSFNIR